MGTGAGVTHFVTGLLFVQVLLGLYQFSIAGNAGRPESVARATRLPTPTLFVHVMVAVIAVILWLVVEGTGWRGVAWATFATLVVGASIGSFMGLRTVGRPTTVAETQGMQAEAASLIVAEKQIPGVSIALHWTIGLAAVVCSLLVCLGV